MMAASANEPPRQEGAPQVPALHAQHSAMHIAVLSHIHAALCCAVQRDVENVAYERLEVSSPGLDRVLRKESDFVRFSGQAIELTLKAPFQGRKHWRGILGGSPSGWSLALQDERQGSELAFKLEELREARLVPVFDFKGRGRATRPAG